MCVESTETHHQSTFDNTHFEESLCRFAVCDCLTFHGPGIKTDGFSETIRLTTFVIDRYNIIKTKSCLEKNIAHVQIFLKLQVGQVDLCSLLTLEVPGALTGRTVQVVPFDLLALSALVPLLTLSGKNTMLVLAKHAAIQHGGTVMMLSSEHTSPFCPIGPVEPCRCKSG